MIEHSSRFKETKKKVAILALVFCINPPAIGQNVSKFPSQNYLNNTATVRCHCGPAVLGVCKRIELLDLRNRACYSSSEGEQNFDRLKEWLITTFTDKLDPLPKVHHDSCSNWLILHASNATHDQLDGQIPDILLSIPLMPSTLGVKKEAFDREYAELLSLINPETLVKHAPVPLPPKIFSPGAQDTFNKKLQREMEKLNRDPNVLPDELYPVPTLKIPSSDGSIK